MNATAPKPTALEELCGMYRSLRGLVEQAGSVPATEVPPAGAEA
jgi:hypothetical protein